MADITSENRSYDVRSLSAKSRCGRRSLRKPVVCYFHFSLDDSRWIGYPLYPAIATHGTGATLDAAECDLRSSLSEEFAVLRSDYPSNLSRHLRLQTEMLADVFGVQLEA